VGTPTRHHRSEAVARDGWGDFFRVLSVCLALVAMVLPPDEAAVVPDDEAGLAVVAQPGRAVATVAVLVHGLTAVAPEDNELEGGPDDDDFRPSPDRACGLDFRAAPLSPLAVRCPAAPALPTVNFEAVSLCAGEFLAAAHTCGCPALDTAVQFLC
jgi:hypothetical protein